MHRLLWLTENYPPDRGGMSVSCDRIVRGLRRAGVQVDVVHLDRSFPDAAHTINVTWNRIRESHPTHVVAFGGYLPLLAAPMFAAWLDCPLVTLIRGNELDTGLFDPRRKPVLDDALRRSAAVCTVTSEHAEKIAALYEGLEPRVIANGIDFELWQATDGDRARATVIPSVVEGPGGAGGAPPAHTGPSTTLGMTRKLGFFGHLKAKKGVPFFLDALRKTKHEFHLLIVGEGELALDDLPHTRVAALDRFELIPHYLACDFVVLPSHYDGFPNVLIESAALGIPAIASRVGGMKDLPAAILFEPGDEHDCRSAIDRAARMCSDEIRALGTTSQQLVREKCDAREEARRYVELFDDSLLRDRRRPRTSLPRAPRAHAPRPARSFGDPHRS
ncbi:MAG TPA: glycosyltransferase family 4 protein [Thermoanaerobaculia bacterium]|nr:glycosyltransferase family 4 protein [Thermoanaerobaculia bacterium]